MGVYIRGMEMPKSCRDCRFCNGQANTDYGVWAWCDVDGKARDAYTMQDCPLVPVQPHGRLIDADAFEDFIRKDWDKNDHWIADVVYSRPTIIPADPAEEGE